MITFNMNGETICHETRTKVTGADVLMKPAAPGTGIIAGGTVRAIMGLTGVKNLISKSLGSTNKVNIAYAVIDGLRSQVPRSEWNSTKVNATKSKTDKIEEAIAKKSEKIAAAKEKVEKAKKTVAKKVEAKKTEAKKAVTKKVEAKKAEVKKAVAKKVEAKKSTAKKEDK